MLKTAEGPSTPLAVPVISSECAKLHRCLRKAEYVLHVAVDWANGLTINCIYMEGKYEAVTTYLKSAFYL